MAKNDEVAQTFHEGMERARERIEETQERLSQAAKRAKEKGEELWEDAADYVQENPGKTVALSLGLGVLIGLILGRCSRD